MNRTITLTPSLIDGMAKGSLNDPLTPGLAIQMLSRGKKVWKYMRWVPGKQGFLRRTLGTYPAFTIAAAREWANELNAMIDAGSDPRDIWQEQERRDTMTVNRAHVLYMNAVREGRASRSKRKNKPRTIADKIAIFSRDVEPKLGKKIIYDVTEDDLIALVEKKGKAAKVRANRLAAELKVFFGWTASLRGKEVGLEVDPARRLGDLRFPETPRARKLSLDELSWFLRALAEERRDFRRGMLLWLLTAARFSEVVFAKTAELQDGIWTIPAERSKNGQAHRIALGPWGLRLFRSNSEWLFPAEKVEGPRTQGWYEARDRVVARMAKLAGRPIERFTPHDFRRTARSNTKRLHVDFETAEAMLNHLKTGLERTYDRYDLEEEKRRWFARWENEVLAIARRAGVHEQLEGADAVSGAARSPQGPAVEPGLHL
ncbi:integrase arm-type DNA-binding domain-containing protein [Sphingobium sp. LMA1-1-1.1]|uniref:tyrosine-type recombinase/integrase n=1 Tax=unclassified Sphingobium TaxID=2611147 RepID=UPI0034125584